MVALPAGLSDFFEFLKAWENIFSLAERSNFLGNTHGNFANFFGVKNQDALDPAANEVGDDFVWSDAGGMCGKGGQDGLPVTFGAPHIRIQDVIVGGK